MKRLLAEEKLALEIVRSIDDGTTGTIPNGINYTDIDWQRLREILGYHDLTPFAYIFFKDTDIEIPQDFRELLENTYYYYLIRNQKLWSEFLRILDAFIDAGADLVPIKGIALLEDLYYSIPARPMIDIDLLAHRQDLVTAENIFAGLGYQKEFYGLKEQYLLDNQYHISFHGRNTKNLPLVELHWALDYPRDGRIVYPELWARIREVDFDGRKIKLLSPEDNLLSLALHNRRFGKTLGFKSVYDAVLLLKKYGDSFDWSYCFEICKKYRLYTTLYFMLCQVRLVGQGSITDEVLKRFNLSQARRNKIQDFIQTNSFVTDGHAAKELYLESHFLLYDSIWEPINYILNIPKEQFAKYYNLMPYSKKTGFFYCFRYFYIPLKAVLSRLSV